MIKIRQEKFQIAYERVCHEMGVWHKLIKSDT